MATVTSPSAETWQLSWIESSGRKSAWANASAAAATSAAVASWSVAAGPPPIMNPPCRVGRAVWAPQVARPPSGVAREARETDEPWNLPGETSVTAEDLPYGRPGCANLCASRQLPVNGLGALLLEQTVGTAERPRAEEAAVGRVRARVGRFHARHTGHQRGQVAGVAAPQDRHERGAPVGERPDGLLGDFFPAFAAVRAWLAGLYGQHSVQQHDAALAPRAEVTRGGRREAEADRMSRRRVRILTHDQHPHVGERLLEGPQHQIAGGQVPAACCDFRPQEIAHGLDAVRHRLQGVSPARIDDLAQRPSCHGSQLYEQRGAGAVA